MTHSTAEAELVSYCKALTVGRATEALLLVRGGGKMEAVAAMVHEVVSSAQSSRASAAVVSSVAAEL